MRSNPVTTTTNTAQAARVEYRRIGPVSSSVSAVSRTSSRASTRPPIQSPAATKCAHCESSGGTANVTLDACPEAARTPIAAIAAAPAGHNIQRHRGRDAATTAQPAATRVRASSRW